MEENNNTNINNETEILMIENLKEDEEKDKLSLKEATIEENIAKLDFLGPIIINSDGTLSRIPNWLNLTKNEQLNILRVIAKRNKVRKEALEQQQQRELEEQQQEEQLNTQNSQNSSEEHKEIG